jgi:hypothetical protein
MSGGMEEAARKEELLRQREAEARKLEGYVQLPEQRQRAQRQETLFEHAREVVELVLAKGEAYGDSYRARSGRLADTVFENSIRIQDKASRLYTLSRKWAMGETLRDNGESIQDTLRDMAGYALLLLAEMEAGA